MSSVFLAAQEGPTPSHLRDQQVPFLRIMGCMHVINTRKEAVAAAGAAALQVLGAVRTGCRAGQGCVSQEGVLQGSCLQVWSKEPLASGLVRAQRRWRMEKQMSSGCRAAGMAGKTL